MLRRKKKSEPTPSDQAQAAPPEQAPVDPQIGSVDPVTSQADAAPTSQLEQVEQGAPVEQAEAPSAPAAIADQDAPQPGRAVARFPDAPAAAPDRLAPDEVVGYNLDSAEAVQKRPRYRPSDDVLSPAGVSEEHLSVSFWKESVAEVLTKSGTSTAEERERQAAADFQAAIMPGLMGLRDAVPDAATPDEALAALARQEAEHDYPEDPEGLSLAQRDIFRTDASVYYRIRNRFDRPRRRVGWGNPWRPPPGLAQPDPPHRALNRGE